AQNITKVSGDGQLVTTFGYFLPMWVQVTDSNGVPQPGVTVNWLISQGGYGAQLLSGAASTTPADGTTFNTYYLGGYSPYGSSTLQYAQNTVTASTSSMQVSFTLSQALADQNNPTFVPVGVFAPLNSLFQYLIGGQTLTGQAGTSGSPIQVYVATSAGIGIANVSVQLGNYQDASVGPVVKCAENSGGELNTAMTDVNGLATCTPVFSGLPETGQFYVLAGYGGATLPLDLTTLPYGSGN